MCRQDISKKGQTYSKHGGNPTNFCVRMGLKPISFAHLDRLVAGPAVDVKQFESSRLQSLCCKWMNINFESINPDGEEQPIEQPAKNGPFRKTWSDPVVFEKMVPPDHICSLRGFDLSVPLSGSGEVTATSRGCHY